MALRIWLPLNGTNINQGISGTTMSGSPSSWSAAGKIGKCAAFSNNATNVIYANVHDYDYTTEDFSWAMWLKKDKSAVTTTMYAFTVGRADAGGYGYGMQVLNSTQVRFKFGTASYDVSCPDNEWHHFAFTKQGTTICTYVDGVLNGGKRTFSGSYPTYSDGNGIGIGCFHYSGNIYPLTGSVNDFRIYDHTLSPKEVYQLSKGLCLHYKLKDFGNAGGNENWFANSSNFTSTSGWGSTNGSTVSLVNIDGIPVLTATKGTSSQLFNRQIAVPYVANTTVYYTISFRIYASVTGNIGSGWWLSPTGSWVGLQSACSYYVDGKQTQAVPLGWHYVEMRCTLKHTTQSDTKMIWGVNYSGTTAYFTELKCEVGTAATPYAPRAYEQLYPTLGYSCPRNIIPGTSASSKTCNVGQYWSNPLYSSNTFWGLNAGSYATLSMWITAPATKKMRVRIQFYNSDSSRTSITGNQIAAGQSGYSSVSFQLTEAQRACAQMQIGIDCNDGTTDTQAVTYSRVKLEYGGSRTEWCPNEADETYAAYGYSAPRVIDESGLGNDSISTSGSFSTIMQSPRNYSAVQPSQQSYIKFHLPEQMEQATYSYWIKPTTAGYKAICYAAGSPTEGKHVWLAANTEGNGLWTYIAGASPNYHRCNAELSNEWHHCCWVFDKGTSAWYLDGNHVGTDVTWNGLTAIANTRDLTIGDSYGGSSWGGTPMTDPISDFRIYATALTADDVKSLYNVGATMDDSGKLYCGELDEFGSRASAQKNTVFMSTGVNEPGGCSGYLNSSTLTGYGLPNNSAEYTPAKDTDNSCGPGIGSLTHDPNIHQYRVEYDFEWSGGFDASSSAGTFSFNHRIYMYKIADGSVYWGSPANTPASNAAPLKTWVLGSASGKKHVSYSFTLTDSDLATYKSTGFSFRVNYSNGTGKWKTSNFKVYPERDYKNRVCSINNDGSVSTKELDEALF